jgi:hypothetical protein
MGIYSRLKRPKGFKKINHHISIRVEQKGKKDRPE